MVIVIINHKVRFAHNDSEFCKRDIFKIDTFKNTANVPLVLANLYQNDLLVLSLRPGYHKVSLSFQ